MPISGVWMLWCAPPFGRQRDARRRRDDHEAGVLVAGVVQRIEAARDERVVERADRQQAGAEQLVAQPERGELDEQVVLGDAELDVLGRVASCATAGPTRP
jgi:hypothetical protein